MLDNTLNAPPTWSNLPMEQTPKSHLHFLEIVKVVCKLERVLLLGSTPTADDLSSHYSSKTSRVAHCFMSNNRFFQWSKLSYARPNVSSKRATGDQLLELPWHGSSCVHQTIPGRSKENILPTNTICLKPTYIRKLLHFYKINVKIVTSLAPIFSRCKRQSELIALSSWKIKNGPQASTQGPPKNIHFASEAQVQIFFGHWVPIYF